MIIEFLTQDDPIYVLPFFDEFFRDYASDFRIERVVVSRVMGKRSRGQLAKELLLLYGPIGFIRLFARLLRSKCLGKLPKRRSAAVYYSLEQLCKAYGVKYERIGDPNDKEFVDQLKARHPDILVSVACPYILKSDLLSLPPLGCVNIHHAPLPRYKGMMPTFWQMFHGEHSVGVSVHYMAGKVDEGAVLIQQSLNIQPGETLDHLIRRSKRHGAHCMAEALHGIECGKTMQVPLDQSRGTYFTFPKPAEIREFHQKGLRAI